MVVNFSVIVGPIPPDWPICLKQAPIRAVAVKLSYRIVSYRIALYGVYEHVEMLPRQSSWSPQCRWYRAKFLRDLDSQLLAVTSPCMLCMLWLQDFETGIVKNNIVVH